MNAAYFYLMTDDPDRVRAVAPRLAAYWTERRPLRLSGWSVRRSQRWSHHLRGRFGRGGDTPRRGRPFRDRGTHRGELPEGMARLTFDDCRATRLED